jgi:hypothetical protein
VPAGRRFRTESLGRLGTEPGMQDEQQIQHGFFGVITRTAEMGEGSEPRNHT